MRPWIVFNKRQNVFNLWLQKHPFQSYFCLYTASKHCQFLSILHSCLQVKKYGIMAIFKPDLQQYGVFFLQKLWYFIIPHYTIIVYGKVKGLVGEIKYAYALWRILLNLNYLKSLLEWFPWSSVLPALFSTITQLQQ